MNSKKKKPNIYRVRKSWTEPSSEIGVYTSLKVASGLCDSNPDFSVYNKFGKVIYSPKRGIDIRKS